ncbi:MAG TPA: ROK family protein [Streptosporangiales bacterium]
MTRDGSGDGGEPYVLGLDIGGTKLAAGVVTPRGEALSFVVGPGGSGDDAESGVKRLFALGREAMTAAGVEPSRIGAVGIGCGGPLDPARGVLVAPPHLPGWRDVPITAWAQHEFDRPAVVENDGTAAAAAEFRFGAGRGVSDLVYLTVSTGVGGGAVVAGRLFRGAAGNGGEFGHVTVDWHGRRCVGCGRRGCLEAYASGTSIAERAREAVHAGEPSSLPGGATAADVAAAAAAGDPLAVRIWDETTLALGCGLTSIVNVFEPEVAVLGGGVTESGEQLLAPVRARVEADAMAAAAERVRVVPAALGRRVGVIGAAAAVWERERETADGRREST